MARKIPAKRHRGVKDPAKQRAKRLTELESCSNAPPKDADEQPIPKSLERVIELKEAAKNDAGFVKRRKRRKKKENALICVGQQQQPSRTSLHPKARPEKVVPVFQQRPGESGRRFLNRITRDTEAFIKETAFEKKYGVQIERDPETGQIQGLTKRKRDEVDDAEALRGKHKNIKKRKKVTGDAVTLTKSEKRQLKSRVKREKKLEEDEDEFEKFQDKVAFGEVAHEPPRLTMKTGRITSERKPKGLLLNSLLQSTKEVSSTCRAIDRSAKRKKLPVAERKMLERQQSEAIAAYRRLKSQRSASRSC